MNQERSQMSKPRHLFWKHDLFLNAEAAASNVVKETEYMCLHTFFLGHWNLATLDCFVQLALPAVCNILFLSLPGNPAHSLKMSTVTQPFSLIYLCGCMISRVSCVEHFVTQWTIAHKAPLSKGFSRCEYWSESPCPPVIPYPRIEPGSLMSPALAGGFLTTSTTWEACLSL